LAVLDTLDQKSCSPETYHAIVQCVGEAKMFLPK